VKLRVFRSVMPGLVPGTHAGTFLRVAEKRSTDEGKYSASTACTAWVPATSAGMTLRPYQ